MVTVAREEARERDTTPFTPQQRWVQNPQALSSCCKKGVILAQTQHLGGFLPQQHNLFMSSPVSSVCITVFGIKSPHYGCSCEHHDICGHQVHLDMVVRFRMALVKDGKGFFCCVCLFFITQLTFVSSFR